MANQVQKHRETLVGYLDPIHIKKLALILTTPKPNDRAQTQTLKTNAFSLIISNSGKVRLYKNNENYLQNLRETLLPYLGEMIIDNFIQTLKPLMQRETYDLDNYVAKRQRITITFDASHPDKLEIQGGTPEQKTRIQQYLTLLTTILNIPKNEPIPMFYGIAGLKFCTY